MLSYRGLTNSSGTELSVRRKAAIKKAFKRLDPLGSGAVKLDDVFRTLAMAPILTADGRQELTSRFGALATQGADGSRLLTFAAFMSYYVEVASGIRSESDFEQLLEAHWGYFEVSDILAAFQRQLTLTGLSIAFKDYAQPGDFANMTSKDFDACIKRVGLLLRPEDLQRLWGAFFNPGSGIGLSELKEQLVNPRPETPVPMSRGLGPMDGPLPLGASTSPGSTSMPPLTNGGSTVAATPSAAASAPPPLHQDPGIHAALGQMQAELHDLKSKKQAAAAGAAGSGENGPPPSDADLDAALSRLENNLHKVKTHKAKVEAAAANPPPAIAPVDMPHWEHHKYGHHKITEPAWKPEKTVEDMYGHKHDAAEYHYSTFGAGGHGHHVAHFHLNDYHGLAHHSFKAEEYHKASHGDAAHHGHWVPHLHGIGTADHHGKHSYGNEDYHKHSFGASGHHGHWVPHLHGIGDKK